MIHRLPGSLLLPAVVPALAAAMAFLLIKVPPADAARLMLSFTRTAIAADEPVRPLVRPLPATPFSR